MLSKSSLLTGVFLILINLPAFTQRSTPTELRIDNVYSGEAIQAYDFRPRELEGSLYYSEEAMPGAIKLHNDRKLTAERVLYNLESNALEILTDRGAFSIPGGAVEEFTLQEEQNGESMLVRFVSPVALSGGRDLDKVGFVRFELEGNPSLLSGYEIEILRPNYIPALDAGSRNPKAVQQERFFLYDDRQIKPIPTRRKKAAQLLEPFRSDAAEFLKAERIDLKDRDELVRLFQWLNGE